MATIHGAEFRRGLDVRRLPETTAPGSLLVGKNCHITRGGELEKRAAFVSTYTLPAGETVSLAATASSLYVFGHLAAPAVPSGVAYRQLDFSGVELERVLAWDLFENEIYAVGDFAGYTDTQHFYGTTLVPSRIGTRASALFTVAGGGPGDTINVLVDGVSATGGAVAWAGSDANTALLIANAINATASVPDYLATSLLSVFAIFAFDIGTAANGRTVSFTTVGAVTVTPVVGYTLTNGQDPFLQTTRYCRTVGTKEYTLSGADLQFSSVGDPLDWDGASGGTGYGFIDTSSYTSGSEDLTAAVEYGDTVAVFSQRTVQIWALAADPAANAFVKVLRNTGTSCPRSVTQYGDSDIFYLDESGLRSVRSLNWSGAASSAGVAVRIDPLIVAKLRSLTEAERALVIGLVEPQDGRLWLIMKDTIFVLSYFPDEGINAWTLYEPGFTVHDAVVFNRRVYLRSGDTIYCYGGASTGQQTDATVAEAWTAYNDGEDPAVRKHWQALDVAVSGEWAVAVGMDLADTDTEDDVAILDRTSFGSERVPLVGESTHLSLRFRSRGTGAAKVGAYAVRYE